MLIFLDRQHTGQINRLHSTGASRDIDGDGKVEIHEMEAFYTPYYLLSAEIRLRELGYKTIFLSDGTYAERHKRCNEYQNQHGGEAIYIAAHLNAGAGGGDGYGAMFYDHRSTKGASLAKHISEYTAAVLPELKGKCKAIPAKSTDWTKNAYYCIKGVRAYAICAEPAFIDSMAHRPLFNASGMRRIGDCIANGIHSFILGD